jgi:hypothetical protein
MYTITGLKALKNLKILSIGRNCLKKFDGLEEVSESLEQLWVSYNLIEKLSGIEAMTNIKVLYMSNNLVSKWPEIQRLSALPFLEELLLQVRSIGLLCFSGVSNTSTHPNFSDPKNTFFHKGAMSLRTPFLCKRIF